MATQSATAETSNRLVVDPDGWCDGGSRPISSQNAWPLLCDCARQCYKCGRRMWMKVNFGVSSGEWCVLASQTASLRRATLIVRCEMGNENAMSKRMRPRAREDDLCSLQDAKVVRPTHSLLAVLQGANPGSQ